MRQRHLAVFGVKIIVGELSVERRNSRVCTAHRQQHGRQQRQQTARTGCLAWQCFSTTGHCICSALGQSLVLLYSGHEQDGTAAEVVWTSSSQHQAVGSVVAIVLSRHLRHLFPGLQEDRDSIHTHTCTHKHASRGIYCCEWV